MADFTKVVSLIVVTAICVESSCDFPSEISGTWYSSHKGALNFSDNQVIEYPIYMSALVNTLDFNCDQKSGSLYMLKSTKAVFAFNSLIEAYICVEFFRVSAYKYYYYLGTALSGTNNDYVYGAQNGTVVSMSQACNRGTPYDTRTFITLIKNDSATTGLAAATCPTDLLASYSSITISEHDGSSSCTGNSVSGCNDKVKQMFTYQSCASSMVYSSVGNFTCIYHVTRSDTTYLSLWNHDDTVDGSSTYRFVCVAFKKSGDTVSATEYPNFCSDESQDSTTVSSPGNKMTLTSMTASCSYTVSNPSNPGWIILILVLVAMAIGGVIVAIYLLKKHRPKIGIKLELNRIS